MSVGRCSVCYKTGLEEDFVYAPIDETHETIYCYDCAPEDALKQKWPVDEVRQEIDEKTD